MPSRREAAGRCVERRPRIMLWRLLIPCPLTPLLKPVDSVVGVVVSIVVVSVPSVGSSPFFLSGGPLELSQPAHPPISPPPASPMSRGLRQLTAPVRISPTPICPPSSGRQRKFFLHSHARAHGWTGFG